MEAVLADLVDAHRERDSTQAFHYTHVSPAHRYIWVASMKVASTTTGTALCQLDGIDLPDGNVWQADNIPKLEDFSTPEIVEMLSSPDWFRFCFVRDPYTRLFSAYKSKIGNANAEPFYQQAQNDIRDVFDYPQEDGKRVGTVTFKDFVHFVQSGARSGDSHWCVQRERLMSDLVPYDFIGRYEHFGSDMTHVLDRLDASPEVRATAAEVRGKSPSISHKTAYDQQLADLVYEIYRVDFESFNYPRDTWKPGPA